MNNFLGASGKINSFENIFKEMSKKEKLITSPNKLTFLSNNHPSHPFEALPSDADWRCDGKEIFGACKSNINNLFSPFGYGLMRYKSVWCVKILIYARDVLEQKTMLK